MTYLDIIGYIGMAFVVLSFMCKDIKNIRKLNIIGAIFNVVYGLITKTSATALLNLVLIIINIIHLTKKSGDEDG